MPKYGFLVVEGPHDVEFVYRLLNPFGLERVRLEKDLDEFMQPLVPRTFPHGGDLEKRVPVPLFLQSPTHVIAVRSASGDTRLAETLEESASRIDFKQFIGVGIVLDTDREIPAAERYAALKTGLLSKGFSFPEAPGTVGAESPRFGAFVLPDNHSSGNLEDLLLECAEAAYPNVLTSAKSHVAAAKNDVSLQNDGADLSKAPIANKAIVGTIASILRPGKAVQTSIQDNKWLRVENLKIGRVKAVQEFLVNLLELY